MSPETLCLRRAPAGVRVVDGTTTWAFEAVVRRRIEAAEARGVELGRRAELEAAAGALFDAAKRLDGAVDEARAEVGRSAVDLALEIARTLLRVEVDAGRYDLETIVRESLAASGVGRASCTVHLHPGDLERLAGTSFRAGTELEADTSVARGDVQVAMADGLLVRDLERAVAMIGERLRGALR